ncbi:MAG: deoxyribodipyrimidine photo-lyase, partial [Gammaproteobacteria bacterium]
MNNAISIVWFRQDLRLANNPAFAAALDRGRVLPVYILDDDAAGEWRSGAASRWWLQQSLHSLDNSLGRQLQVYRGNSREILTRLAAEHQASTILWNRCYEPWRIQQDRQLNESLA